MPSISTTEQSLERLAKLSVEYRVDDGVKGGVDVPQPEYESEDGTRNLEPNQQRDGVEGKEGQPAPHEGRHDDTEDQRRPPLLQARCPSPPQTMLVADGRRRGTRDP